MATGAWRFPSWLLESPHGGLVLGVLDGEVEIGRPIKEMEFMDAISVTIEVAPGEEWCGEAVLERLAVALRAEALRAEPKATRVLFTDVATVVGEREWVGRGMCVR